MKYFAWSLNSNAMSRADFGDEGVGEWGSAGVEDEGWGMRDEG